LRKDDPRVRESFLEQINGSFPDYVHIYTDASLDREAASKSGSICKIREKPQMFLCNLDIRLALHKARIDG